MAEDLAYHIYSRWHSIGYRRRSASLWLVRQDQANTFGQSAILRLRLWEMIGVDTICCSCNWTSWLSSLRLWWQQTESWAESCSALTASSALRCFTRWHCSTNNCFSSACSTHQHTVSHPHPISITLWYRHSRWTLGMQYKYGLGNNTHTHTHPFNGPFSGTTRVSRYQKGKINLDFTEARDSEWKWHQLGHMQVCTSLQTDNHASTPPLSFLQAGCPSYCPTNSVKALK